MVESRKSQKIPRSLRPIFIGLVLAVCSWGCSSQRDVTTPVPRVASVEVSPSNVTLRPGTTVTLVATVKDQDGRALSDKPVTWASSSLTRADVSNTGLVSARDTGAATITATSDGKSGNAEVNVIRTPVATVSITPQQTLVRDGSTAQLTAITLDSAGDTLSGRVMNWTSLDPTTVQISQTGLATSVRPGSANVTATSEGKTGSARLRVVVDFATISAGGAHTCATSTIGRTYCWGNNQDGQLGNGLMTAGSRGDSFPVPTVAQVAFESVAAGSDSHTCALSALHTAYCWGTNDYGKLGIGSSSPDQCTPSLFPCSTRPMQVVTGIAFSQITAGGNHTCAIGNEVGYCWGYNASGQLGLGTTVGPEDCGGVPCSTMPAPVIGGLSFALITAGALHTCGLTTGGIAYCWGRNDRGELGDSTLIDKSAPTPVAGNLSFSMLSAGDEFTCGVTVAGALYCWGWDAVGQLGDSAGAGTSSIPIRVSSNLTFANVTTGIYHACAVTTIGAGYCWGVNADGQGGYDPSGSGTVSRKPLLVGGGLTFQTIAAGGYHTCGLTTTGTAYCWGSVKDGQIGNGSTRGPDTCSSGFACALLPSKVLNQP